MTEQKKNTIITSGIAVLAVILAYCFRIVGRGSFYPMLFSYLRSFIYIGLFAAWGLSVRQRIVQKQVCRFMTVTAVLLIIWMVVRSAKYFIFWQPDAVRYLWYLFYLPMLFVPMLALLIAMSLGKPDEYKFPKGMSILWIISGTLLLLVLTNDLHQFVFTFPKDAAVWTDKNNGYSIGYFIIVGWQVLCAFAALVIMFLKCRVQKGRLHFLPIVPMLLTIVYSVLYYAGADWLLHLFGDIAAFQSVMYILTFEFCIACGYIHSNSRYVDLFASSVGTSAEITDKDFTVRYAAVNTAPISKETMKKAEQSPVTMGGLTVHTMPYGQRMCRLCVTSRRTPSFLQTSLPTGTKCSVMNTSVKPSAARWRSKTACMISFVPLRRRRSTALQSSLRNTAESQAPIPTVPKRSLPRSPCCAAILNAASI